MSSTNSLALNYFLYSTGIIYHKKFIFNKKCAFCNTFCNVTTLSKSKLPNHNILIKITTYKEKLEA